MSTRRYEKMSSILVYTCVFDDYDWVLPPCTPEPDVDYVLVTEATGPAPSGWRRNVVDPAEWGGGRAANRYWKMLGHRDLVDGHERVLYVDANCRLLGDLRSFLDQALPEGVALGLFRHPLRNSVSEEAKAIAAAGKVGDEDAICRELAYYAQDGFQDDMGLSENTIIAFHPGEPRLDEALELWWALYQRSAGRDQLSLPFVRWKTGILVHWIDWSFREPNPYFALYTHRGDRRAPHFYGYVEGRGYDSRFYLAILKAWQFSWRVRRAFRKKPGSGRRPG